MSRINISRKQKTVLTTDEMTIMQQLAADALALHNSLRVIRFQTGMSYFSIVGIETKHLREALNTYLKMAAAMAEVSRLLD